MATLAPGRSSTGLNDTPRPTTLRRPALRRPAVSRSVAAVAALTALAAAVRFTGLGQQSLWFDEGHTVWIVHRSFGSMLRRLPATEATPPLYFVLAWLWTHLMGFGATQVRSMSALFGVLTVPVVWATGRRLLSERVGLAVAALATCSPMLIWYSQEARSYALMVLLTSVALLAWAHLREEPTGRWAAAWAVASALGLATHYYAALVIVPEAAWLIGRHRHLRSVRWAVEGVFVCGLALLPLLRLQLDGIGGTSSWIARISLVWRVGLVPRSFAIGPDSGLAVWLIAATALCVLTALVLLRWRAEPSWRTRAIPAAGLLVAGVAILAAMQAAGYDQLNDRNLLGLWLPTALIVAAGLAGPRAGRVGAISLVVLCAVGLTAAATVRLDTRSAPRLEEGRRDR